MVKVNVRALENFAGAQGAMHVGQEAELEKPYAESLERCGYVEMLKEAGEKENKRVNKRRSMAASKRNIGGNVWGRQPVSGYLKNSRC